MRWTWGLIALAAVWMAAGPSAIASAQGTDGKKRVVRGTFERDGKRATLRRMRISGLTPGVSVGFSCRGEGCRAPRPLGARRGGVVNGMRAFTERITLSPGARLDVWVVLPDGRADVVRYRVGRRGRVSVRTLCAPGTEFQPQRC